MSHTVLVVEDDVELCEMLCEAPRLSFRELQLACASVDLEQMRNYRARSPSMAA